MDLRDSENHPFLGQQIAQPRSFSDQTAARVDKAVITLLHAAETEALLIIEFSLNNAITQSKRRYASALAGFGQPTRSQ